MNRFCGHLAGIRRVVGQAGRQLGDAGERPRHWERLDLVVRDVLADDRRRDRRGRLGDDVDRLGHAGGHQRDVLFDRQTEGQRELAFDRLEVRQLERDGVLPGRQGTEDERPVTLGDVGSHALQGRRRGRHDHAGHRKPLLVVDDATDGAGLDALCQGAGGEAAEEQEQRTRHE
jgi:hypothetical protein